MDIAKKDEIEACLVSYFTDGITSFKYDTTIEKVVRKELFNEVLPCVIVQWWYYEDYNKIYIYYDIGKLYYIGDKEKFCKNINQRILGSIYKDLKIYAEIVSNVIYGGQYLEIMDCPYTFSNDKITLSVLTYWKIVNGDEKPEGDYHFIHDSHIVLNKMLDNNMDISPEKAADVQEYIAKLAKIAQDYNSYDAALRNQRIPEVFTDIKNLFYEYFGYNLPDPKTYQMMHHNCGPNVFYLDVYENYTFKWN